jgi:hypothetical protein
MDQQSNHTNWTLERLTVLHVYIFHGKRFIAQGVKAAQNRMLPAQNFLLEAPLQHPVLVPRSARAKTEASRMLLL